MNQVIAKVNKKKPTNTTLGKNITPLTPKTPVTQNGYHDSDTKNNSKKKQQKQKTTSNKKSTKKKSPHKKEVQSDKKTPTSNNKKRSNSQTTDGDSGEDDNVDASHALLDLGVDEAAKKAKKQKLKNTPQSQKTFTPSPSTAQPIPKQQLDKFANVLKSPYTVNKPSNILV